MGVRVEQRRSVASEQPHQKPYRDGCERADDGDHSRALAAALLLG